MNKEEAAALLGVEVTATKEQVRTAFQTLAKKHHPDKTSGDDKMIKLIIEAYKKLTNENPTVAMVPVESRGQAGPLIGAYDTRDLREVTMTLGDYKSDLHELETSVAGKPDYIRDIAEMIGLSVGSMTAYQTIPTWPNVGPTLTAGSLLVLVWRAVTTLKKLFGSRKALTREDLIKRRTPPSSGRR